jgi:hypothetical protein
MVNCHLSSLASTPSAYGFRAAPMDPAPPIARPLPRRRPRWRLRTLLAINFFVLILFVISRLEPSSAKPLGFGIEAVYQFLVPPDEDSISKPGQELIAEVRALGGQAHVMERTRKVLGIFGPSGPSETFYVMLFGPAVDDEGFARFVEKYGDRISGLGIDGTRVSDRGLASLRRIPRLHTLSLTNQRRLPGSSPPASPITDAGMVHLNIPTLTSVNLSGLPITDDGLKLLADLPDLSALYLSQTKVGGPGLSRLRSLPKLIILYLENSSMTEDGLGHLAGASNLQVLSLDRVPMTAAGLKRLNGLTRLTQLELHRCGLLDEEIASFRVNMPELKIER